MKVVKEFLKNSMKGVVAVCCEKRNNFIGAVSYRFVLLTKEISIAQTAPENVSDTPEQFFCCPLFFEKRRIAEKVTQHEALFSRSLHSSVGLGRFSHSFFMEESPN